MEDRDVEQTDTGEDTPKLSDKPKEPDRELARMKRALKAQQAERAQALAELETLRKQIEDEKLSAQERERKELEAIRKQAEDAQRKLSEREAEMERLRLVNRLVSKHKLADEEYADVVLKRYNPDEHDDFDAFVSELVEQPKYKVFFEQPQVAAAPLPPAPPVPGSGNNRERAVKTSPEDEILATARQLFPTDAARRETYIRQLKAMKGIN